MRKFAEIRTRHGTGKARSMSKTRLNHQRRDYIPFSTSFQVLLRSFLVFKCTDQNFAGWLVTSKRNPTERVAPSPRPFPRIASGRLETKYSFPDFSPKISAREIHETSIWRHYTHQGTGSIIFSLSSFTYLLRFHSH